MNALKYPYYWPGLNNIQIFYKLNNSHKKWCKSATLSSNGPKEKIESSWKSGWETSQKKNLILLRTPSASKESVTRKSMLSILKFLAPSILNSPNGTKLDFICLLSFKRKILKKSFGPDWRRVQLSANTFRLTGQNGLKRMRNKMKRIKA